MGLRLVFLYGGVGGSIVWFSSCGSYYGYFGELGIEA